MKKKQIIVLGMLTAIAALSSYGQSDTNSPARPPGLPPGLQNREQLPPGLQKREQLPPGLQGRTEEADTNTSQVTDQDNTNQLSQYGTNRFGTNRFGQALTNFGRGSTNFLGHLGSNVSRLGSNVYGWASNRFSTNRLLAPTGGATNRVYATNSSSAQSASTTSRIYRDQAYTPADQTLLVRIHQKVQTTIQSTQVYAPVHYICREGVVTVVGYVPEQQQKQQIISVVQQTPGVVQVIDQIQVTASAAGQDQSSGQDFVAVQDQAVTTTDQQLLVQLRQEVVTVLGTSAQVAVPVHFICRNGNVTLVGLVPDQQQKEKIVTLVRRTPGVVQVIDQLQVNATANVNAGSGSTNTIATSTNSINNDASLAGAAASTNWSTSSTNLSPTSRTNAPERQYEQDRDGKLPPGLEKRDTLPPGLEKRRELPPGLEKRESH